MIKVKIEKIKERSKDRPAGYFEDVISYGKINGEFIELNDVDYEFLVKKYNNNSQDISEPTNADLLFNFSTAVSKWISAGFPVLNESEFSKRFSICSSCKFWNSSARFNLGECKHKKCGCTKFKLWIKTEKCPIGKWEATEKTLE
jgi:hypothetical protein